MKILNQHNKYITDKYDHGTKLTHYEDKVQHMISNGYGSIIIDGHKVCLEDTYEADGEEYILVNVEGI